ncbi:hypothetical protein JX265_004809 [Neoarthrinium moseri]|uniref:Heterokaryon incompatibility domain-containing protein n=1 Tax=Neoarthrinium moseri TaxID=1658444 RepID=A0A9Q0AS23_9PEZI|nr:hypothetical protein JX265_004809 [Neoarthrinium moseri]
MDASQPQDEVELCFKRRRTDSSHGGHLQASRASSPRLERQDTMSSSGKRACSPILLSDDHEPEVLVTEEGKVRSTEPRIIIHLGGERQQVPQSKFLAHIWKDGLNSPCMVCQRGFNKEDNDPPIRTFTLEESEDLVGDTADVTRIPLAPHPIRVMNRHMNCIKARRLTYIPVSHVWHQPVSSAQMGKATGARATQLAYQVPIQTLMALTKKFGPTEVWHDYISVPQWQYEIQRQLLLQIPTIFAFPALMIMHLDDSNSFHLRQLEDPDSYTTFVEAISHVTQSRWFDRMWVALEYIQSQEVSILSKYFDISDTSAADLSALAASNLGKYAKRLGQDRFNQIAKSKGFQWQKRVSWDDMEVWKRIDPKYRSLGAAIFIIGQKQCRDPHDYFFALRGLLDLGQNQTEIKTILSDDIFQSFLDLTWDALTVGDYSPLLFIPPDGEQADQRVPWLRGHSSMSERLWDLGTCHQLARSRIIIQQDSIRPMLETIGIVVDFEYYDFGGSSESVFQRVASRMLQMYGPSAQLFCDGIDRVFPHMARKGLPIPQGEISDAEVGSPVSYDLDRIGEMLERYSFSSKGESHGELAILSKRLIALLGLALPDKTSHTSRLQSARDDAEFFGKKKEGLASVRCTTCAGLFLYRVTAWEELVPQEARLYRIPGLLYDDTLPDGVGIAVANGKIVGRMAYATPACECHPEEAVELGHRP